MMLFSLNYLRHLASLSKTITLEQICDAINSIGFEVESTKAFLQVSGLKFGHVLETQINPHSSKLTVCQVQFADQVRTIQTAATNVQAGDYVIAFVPGAKMQNQIIQTRELAQIKSEGMLVSLEELGFSKTLLRPEWQENILIIEPVDLNTDPITYFDLDDHIIEVAILPNRSDAYGYYVFAKELAAYFQTEFNFNFPAQNQQKIISECQLIGDQTNYLHGAIVQLEAPLKLDWKRLMLILKANIASTNEANDYCAWIYLMSGIYPRLIDYQHLTKNELHISKQNNLAYLSNQNQPVAFLGGMVFESYQPKTNSQELLFEFSQLDLKLTRANYKATQNQNLAAFNSTKMVAAGLIDVVYQLLRHDFSFVSNLINELNWHSPAIDFDPAYLNAYAGFDLTKENFYHQALKALAKLDFQMLGQPLKQICVPAYRHDVKTMQDLTEEIFRFYGLNNFVAQQPVIKNHHVQPWNYLEKTISALGYMQAWTYTLVSEEDNQFNPFNFKTSFRLKTFVSQEHCQIRQSQALPLLQIFQYHFKRKIDQLSLFDIGMINDKKALILASNQKSYGQIKADLELLSKQQFRIVPLKQPQLHPHYNAGLFLGHQQVGWIGKLNPFYIDEPVIFGELLLDALYQPKTQFLPYDEEPLKQRDLTITLKAKQSPHLILDQIKALWDKAIFSLELKDVFVQDDLIKQTYTIKLSAAVVADFDQQIEAILATDLNQDKTH